MNLDPAEVGDMPVASNAIAIPEGLDELDVLPRAGLSDLREHAATVSRQYSVFHNVQAERVPLHDSCGIGVLRQRKPLILRDHPGSAGLRNARKVSNRGVQRPKMHFVPVKTLGQQDLQLLGRVRSKLVSQRTELISQVRGLASEYGVTFPTSRAALMAGLPLALEDADNGLTQLARFALLNVLEDIRALDSRLAALTLQTAALAKQEPAYARLLTVPGFGPVVAPTFIAAVGDGKQFEHGRDVSAWLGMVPKQHGTGGKVQLMRISKNGDRDLRTLLIHGARAVLRWVDRRDDAMSRWLVSLRARRGEARTIVALANKLATRSERCRRNRAESAASGRRSCCQHRRDQAPIGSGISRRTCQKNLIFGCPLLSCSRAFAVGSFRARRTQRDTQW
ncbi:MAG: IS110 family transposase [Rhodanobacteraceae bacterium]|nr:IS110 family transposase [Rhodanobacteraceae bacterium]